MRQQIVGGVPDDSYYGFLFLVGALADFAKENGHYPDSLADLTNQEHMPEKDSRKEYLRSRVEESGEFRVDDGWGNRYRCRYERMDTGFRFYGLSQYEQPGGRGVDAELVDTGFQHQEFFGPRYFLHYKPTLHQFLFDLRYSGTLFKVALSASLCAGILCFLSARRRTVPRTSPKTLLFSILVTTGLAVLVSLFLVFLYMMLDHH